jgi:predicted TIM-barrel fold metal-dependent hydrolase
MTATRTVASEAIRVISADDHIDLTYLPRDLFQSRLPEKHRRAGPRVLEGTDGPFWEREGRRWGSWGSKRPGNFIIVYDKAGLAEEPEPGVWRGTSAKYRLADMDAEGVHAQILYNFLDWSFADADLQAACMRAFNDWLAAEMCAKAPDRLIGLATIPTSSGVAAAAELRRSVDLGMKGGFLEIFGAARPIYDEDWTPLWHAAEETGLPISVHTGAGTWTLASIPGRAPWKYPVLAATLGMQLEEVMVSLIMSGVLERHPKLKFVLGESGIGWIPYVLERLEYEVEQFRGVAGGVPIKSTPSELFRRQMYATFSDERTGVELIPRIGIDNVLWAADYPHGDGSFPNSRKVMARMFDDADPGLRRKVLRENSAKLYGLA